jgi:hypothetical protein
LKRQFFKEFAGFWLKPTYAKACCMWHLLVLALVAGPELGPETAYPYLIEGPDQNIFEIVALPTSREKVVDGKLYLVGPDLANDGSAKYVGTKYVDGDFTKRIEIPATYLEILRMQRAARSEVSPWHENAFHIFISREALNTSFQKLGDNPLDILTSLASLSPIKSDVLRKLIFENDIVLSREELEDLSRNHQRPEPVAVSFEIPLTAKGNFDFKDYLRKRYGSEDGWLADLVEALPDGINPLAADVTDWGMEFQRTIQVETLQFVVSERRFILDPDDNQIHVRMKVDLATVSGPILDEGVWVKGVDRSLYSMEKKLVSGEVRGLDLSFSLELELAETEDHWVLALIDETFVLSFLEDQALVHMVVYGEDEHGNVVLREEPAAELKQAHATVEDKLTEVISKALVTRMYPDSLGFGARLNEYGNFYETRLSSWSVYDEGLSIRLAARVQSSPEAACLSGLDTTKPEFEAEAFQAKQESDAFSWGFFWMREPSAWFLGEELQDPHSPLRIPLQPMKTEQNRDFEEQEHFRYWSGPASFSVEISESWINEGLFEMWREGQLCFDETELSEYALNLPEAKMRLVRAPVARQIGSSPQWELSLEMEFWLPTDPRRDWGDPVLPEDFHIQVEWSPLLILNDEASFELQIPEINSPGMSVETRNLVTEAFMFSLELLLEKMQSFAERSREPVRSLSARLDGIDALEWVRPVRLKSRDSWIGFEAYLRQSDLDPLLEALNPDSVLEPSIRPIDLETQFVELPNPVVSSQDLVLHWELKNPQLRDRVKFEIRRAYIADGVSALEEDFGEWLAEQKETYYEVRFDRPGRYEFQVRAISLESPEVVELPDYAQLSIYFAPTEYKAPSKLEEPRNQRDPDAEFSAEDPGDEPRAPHRMGAKGPFGCSVSANTSASSAGYLWSLLSLLFLVVVGSHSRSGRGKV